MDANLLALKSGIGIWRAPFPAPLCSWRKIRLAVLPMQLRKAGCCTAFWGKCRISREQEPRGSFPMQFFRAVSCHNCHFAFEIAISAKSAGQAPKLSA
jgi:hypothetical protein